MEIDEIKDIIRKKFDIFSKDGDGITCWLYKDTPDEVFKRIYNIKADPIGIAQLNQLLLISHYANVSRGFFEYYWFNIDKNHPYKPDKIEPFQPDYLQEKQMISSCDHLLWGFKRLFYDGLLYFGNVTRCFNSIRKKEFDELSNFYSSFCYDSKIMKQRGELIELEHIPIDDRYLISENACKNLEIEKDSYKLKKQLLKRWREFENQFQSNKIQIKYLFLEDSEWEDIVDKDQTSLDKWFGKQKLKKLGETLAKNTAEEIADDWVSSEKEIIENLDKIQKKFVNAREKALSNTQKYLSMVDDLDAYVATSMRNRQNFRDMANKCDSIFKSKKLKDYNLRYFDPTRSAAGGHLDKGIIECLMVKCAKVLIYFSGEKESYGKDAEAAMALSHGKSVIFVCDKEEKRKFYNYIHPLTRLIDVKTGVAVGAMVTDNLEVVVDLIYKILTNDLEYNLENKDGYYMLKERSTNSTIRVQTNDKLLTEIFWNHYYE